MSRTIHLTCGYAFNVIEASALSSDDVISLHDDMSAGPLCDLRGVDNWRAERLSFWERVYDTSGGTKALRRRARDGSEHPIVPEPQRLIDANEIVLWLGTGLPDQLILAWMPQFLRSLGARVEKLHVVQFDRTASCEAIPRLAVLNSAEIRTAPDARAIGDAEFAYLDRAWSAVTSADPAVLLRFLGDESAPLPHVPAAFRLLLRRYPNFRSGISRPDARLLSNTRVHGPTLASVIANSMFALNHDDDRDGDSVLWWRLRRLADPALPHPAVTVTGERTTIRGTEVRLTEVGERVASGKLNFVELNGIEDWVGGVHLDSRVGNVWFQRGELLIRG